MPLRHRDCGFIPALPYWDNSCAGMTIFHRKHRVNQIEVENPVGAIEGGSMKSSARNRALSGTARQPSNHSFLNRFTCWRTAFMLLCVISAPAYAGVNQQCVKSCEKNNCISGEMSAARLGQCRRACVAQCTPVSKPRPLPPPGMQRLCQHHALIGIQTANGHYLTAVNGGGIGEPGNALPMHTDATV